MGAVMGAAMAPGPAAWKPDPTMRCPTAIEGVRVSLDEDPRGVVITVTSPRAAVVTRLRQIADYLGRAARPEQALPVGQRDRCPVVLRGTKVSTRKVTEGVQIVVLAIKSTGVAALRALAVKRLHAAFPLPAAPGWQCGASKTPATPPATAPATPPQAHVAKHIFWSSPEEKLFPTGWDTGDTTVSNEARLELYREVVKDRGGGYVGVGSTQNFVLAAWANAEWIWLMDFTRIVVASNMVHIAFIKESQTPAAFEKLWLPTERTAGLRVIEKHYGQDTGLAFLKESYGKAQRFVARRFKQLHGWEKRYGFTTWLSDQALYNRIRTLALKGRIRALRGNLMGPTTLCGIGAAARRMGVPIRLYYTSNAEEYKWFRPFPWRYRRNVRGIPVDERSLALRTYSMNPQFLPYAKGWKGFSKVGFHYNAQPLSAVQKWMRFPRITLAAMLIGTTRDPDGDGYSLSSAKGPPTR